MEIYDSFTEYLKEAQFLLTLRCSENNSLHITKEQIKVGKFCLESLSKKSLIHSISGEDGAKYFLIPNGIRKTDEIVNYYADIAASRFFPINVFDESLDEAHFLLSLRYTTNNRIWIKPEEKDSIAKMLDNLENKFGLIYALNSNGLYGLNQSGMNFVDRIVDFYKNLEVIS